MINRPPRHYIFILVAMILTSLFISPVNARTSQPPNIRPVTVTDSDYSQVFERGQSATATMQDTDQFIANVRNAKTDASGNTDATTIVSHPSDFYIELRETWMQGYRLSLLDRYSSRSADTIKPYPNTIAFGIVRLADRR